MSVDSANGDDSDASNSINDELPFELTSQSTIRVTAHDVP
jgi:hypothetical protein